MIYQVEIKPLAEKDLKSLPQKDALKILNKILELENGLKGDIKKLTNFIPEFRLRVGSNRILFEIDANVVSVYRVLHRKKAYK